MKYRKKQIVVEAMQYKREENIAKIQDWLKEKGKEGYLVYSAVDNEYFIDTPEGIMKIVDGDWLIIGTKGEVYPCKPDVFSDVYEKDGTVEYEVINNPLFSQKYTRVFGGDFDFNAFHEFIVFNAENGEEIEDVIFQKGPVKENGINGVANEDLLLMVITRLQQFQESDYRCRENAIALTKLEEAVMWLRHRTTSREVRGVEGTSTV